MRNLLGLQKVHLLKAYLVEDAAKAKELNILNGDLEIHDCDCNGREWGFTTSGLNPVF